MMIALSKNNVHVSGQLIEERTLSPSTVQILIGVKQANGEVPFNVVIDQEQWKKFKNDFPGKYNSVTVSGQLQAHRDTNGMNYSIKAGNGSITRFHNILQDYESVSQFYGPVILEKKFDFDTTSNLYLRRMVFKTCTNHPVYFEAMALRGAVPYFDDINEGDRLILKANFVKDANGKPPYWRIKRKPQVQAVV